MLTEEEKGKARSLAEGLLSGTQVERSAIAQRIGAA